MSVLASQKESILKIVGKDGPIMREMKKPQLMHVKVNDYGLKKLKRRSERRSPVRR